MSQGNKARAELFSLKHNVDILRQTQQLQKVAQNPPQIKTASPITQDLSAIQYLTNNPNSIIN